jgi:hypothetical protein
MFTQYIDKFSKLFLQKIAGADNPLPTSIIVLAVSSSAIFAKLEHRLFWAEIGSEFSLFQYPKLSIDPPVASCITGDNVL